MLQSRAYLRDIITTNHLLILNLERASNEPEALVGFLFSFISWLPYYTGLPRFLSNRLLYAGLLIDRLSNRVEFRGLWLCSSVMNGLLSTFVVAPSWFVLEPLLSCSGLFQRINESFGVELLLLVRGLSKTKESFHSNRYNEMNAWLVMLGISSESSSSNCLRKGAERKRFGGCGFWLISLVCVLCCHRRARSTWATTCAASARTRCWSRTAWRSKTSSPTAGSSLRQRVSGSEIQDTVTVTVAAEMLRDRRFFVFGSLAWVRLD